MANKYNLKDILEERYADCKTTLKKSSLDNRDADTVNYLCSDEKLDIFDFDLIKEKIDNSKKSPDSIYIRDKKIYIVEFKNQNPCNINCKDLQEKFKFAIDFFKKLVINIRDYQFIICVVYKNQDQNKESQRYKQRQRQNSCCVLNDANKNDYSNFYNSIITKDVNFYKTKFEELQC